MTTNRDVAQLAKRIEPLLLTARHDFGWGDHLGAALVDAALQPRTRYEAVVLPRVRSFREEHPEASTISGFKPLLGDDNALAKALRFKGARKLRTLRGLASFLETQGVDTRVDLESWLAIDGNADLLRRSVWGVGPKTRDYLCLEMGLPAVAIDSRLRAFAQRVPGLESASDDELRDAYRAAAAQLGVAAGLVDRAVWDSGSKT